MSSHQSKFGFSEVKRKGTLYQHHPEGVQALQRGKMSLDMEHQKQ